MRIGVVGLGLIGGSIALGLSERHDVRGFDRGPATREAASRRGIKVVDAPEGLFPADAVIVATPLAAIVPTLEALAPSADDAVLIEVGSLKSAVAEYARRAPADVRVVGLHPMAGSTASGLANAHPGLLRGRPFLVVATARSDARALEVANAIARELGGLPIPCDAQTHDRAIAAVSALPLAAAVALARAARQGSPLPVDQVGGPGIHDATRLAWTPLELALPLLAAPGLADDIELLRAGLADVRAALGDDAALRALLAEAAPPR